MAAPGSTWAHCIHLHPSSKELSVLFVFTSETWTYASDKLQICFLFLLLSPKRDFITYCRVLRTYLKITHTNQNEKTTGFTNFWPLHRFWVPHHQLERLLHILCQRSESVSWHYLYILPSFHIFHLKLQILFTRGSLCLLKPKKPLFPLQTLFLTQCNELLVVQGLFLVGWLTSRRYFCSLAQSANLHLTNNILLMRFTGPSLR